MVIELLLIKLSINHLIRRLIVVSLEEINLRRDPEVPVCCTSCNDKAIVVTTLM